MRIKSTMRTGFREGGGEPLLDVGEYDLTERLGREPTPNELALVHALVEARLVTILDEAPPPPPASRTRISATAVVKKRVRVAKPAEPVEDPKLAHRPKKRVARR